MPVRLSQILRATLATTAMLFCITSAILAQPPVAAPPTPAPIATENELAALKAKQDANAKLFKQFKESLYNLAKKLEKSDRPEDKDRAKIIYSAIDIALKENVEGQFQKLLLEIGKGGKQLQQFDVLATEDAKLRKMLQDILQVLMTDDETARLKAEIDRLEKILQDVKQVKITQERQRAQNDAKIGDAKRKAQEQEELAKRTQEIADRASNKDGKPNNDNNAKPKDDRSDAKAEPKDGEPKPGDNKAETGEAKADDKGDGKPMGEPKDGKDMGAESKGKGDPKDGDTKGDMKGGPMEAKEGGEGKPSGDPKDGKDPKDPMGGGKDPKDPKDPMGGGKDPKDPMAGKPSKPSDSKADSKSKGEGKGEAKPSDGKGKPSEGKGQPSEGKPMPGQPGQPGQSKPGGQPQPPPPPGGNQPPPGQQTPGRKEIQEAVPQQEGAAKDLDKDQRADASKKQDIAVKKLDEAIKELEKRLKQLREEEMKKLLANLEARCNRMLQMQIEVYNSTKAIDEAIIKGGGVKATSDIQKSQQQGDKEGIIVADADATLKLLESEGSAVAFAIILKEVSQDMIAVQRRLTSAVVDKDTQAIEENIIAMLKDMIDAIKKEQKKMEEKPPMDGMPMESKPQDKKLIDLIAELKLIKSMQMQVNNRTKMYGNKEAGVQATDPIIQSELKQLSSRQAKLQEMVEKIGKGENQ